MESHYSYLLLLSRCLWSVFWINVGKGWRQRRKVVTQNSDCGPLNYVSRETLMLSGYFTSRIMLRWTTWLSC